MQRHSTRWALRSLLALSGAVAGLAQADARPPVTFSGFGTLGYALVDREGAEYRAGNAQDGADASGSFELDSRLGVQVDAILGRSWSATVQLQVRERGDGDVGAEPEWAFVRWRPGDRTAIRVGRMALPAFAISDFRSVGYANVPVRPPEDLYSLIPLERIDGVDVSVEAETGDTLWRLQALAGRSSSEYGDIEFEARDFLGVVAEAERGSVRVRLSHNRSRLNLGFFGGAASTGQASPAGPAPGSMPEGLAAEAPPGSAPTGPPADADPGRTLVSFDAIGLAYDPGGWIVDAEYARRRTDSDAPGASGWAVTAGLRRGAFTPYALVSAYREDDLAPPEGLVLPEGASPDVFSRRDQRTLGLGLRWEAAPNIALKGQIENVASRFVGVSLVRPGDERRPPDGADVTLVALSMDVVF